MILSVHGNPLGAPWPGPTEEITPQFDYHELKLCGDFVRWTDRKVVTRQAYKNTDGDGARQAVR